MQVETGRPRRFAMWRPLAVRDFRLLWIGQSFSLLGDQFYLVALPWLILQLTGSGTVLGTVLLAATVPRVLFQLVGGAVSDRISPRKLMIASNVLRAVVCAVLTALIVGGGVRLWHLIALAAFFGTVDAFFVPALKTFIPTVVNEDQLAASNALLQGTNMLTKFLGPSLAGLIISGVGIGAAFGLDAFSFVFVAFCLLLISRGPNTAANAEQETTGARPAARGNLLASIREGWSYSLREPVIRALIIIITVVEFAFAGPLTVGLASLADNKFAGGSTAFGAMLSALGGGLLLGTLLASSAKSSSRLGTLMLPLTVALGLGLLLLGVAPNVYWACALNAAMGIIAGYLQVLIAVWLQTKSDPQMRGRVFSIVLLFGYGLTPLSYVIAGLLTQVGVSFMFIATGAFLLAATVVCAAGGVVDKLKEA